MTIIRCPRGILPPYSLLLVSAFTIIPISGLNRFSGIAVSDLVKPFVDRTYDPANPSETCYEHLFAAAGEDGVLQNDEYTTFVDQLSDGDFDEENYVDLPFTLKVNFVYLSCLCQFQPGTSGPGCCEGPEAGINLTGADPGITGIPLEDNASGEAYLRTVCGETQGAIEFARQEAGITRSPTNAPTTKPTDSPSNQPTDEPTSSSSDEPTDAPTDSPSASPTNTDSTTPPTIEPETEMPTTPVPVPGEPTKSPSTIAPIVGTVPTSNAPIVTPITTSPADTISPTTSSQPSLSAESVPGVEKPDGDRDGGKGTESESITTGQVVGIALVAAFVVSAAGYVYVNRRKRDREEDPELEDVENKDLDDLEAGQSAKTPGDDGPSGGGEGGELLLESSDAALNYVPSSEDALRLPGTREVALVSGVPTSPVRSKRAAKESDSSSAASESGWSSSAGLSSLNTSTFDEQTDDGSLLPGSPSRLLAAIGVADTVTHSADSAQRDAEPTFVPVDNQSHDNDSAEGHSNTPVHIHSGQEPPGGKVSREDLNRAIEAGDWAMVGATAALLADSTASPDNSESGRRASETYGESAKSILSNQSGSSATNRAEELDRMVEDGDWEGVVLAAAQFSAGDDETSESPGKSSGDTGSSRHLDEIREEVEKLVRRVVPDELDNIDEMMLQFEGREEELIETLRTMQERNVAQRARAAVQKTAKLEAKAKASIASSASASTTSSGNPLQRQRSDSTSSEPSHYGGSSLGSSVSDLEMNTHGSSHSSSYSSSRQTTQSSLELAIERGDWRAVGEAAAMMGGGSDSEAHIIRDSETPSDSVSESASANKSERVYYLDSLIAKGDWAGIVLAAGKYQAMDDESLSDRPPTDEERAALAQADMWEAIASQSKQGSGAAAAEEAADWAISRAMAKSSEGEADPPKSPDDESV